MQEVASWLLARWYRMLRFLASHLTCSCVFSRWQCQARGNWFSLHKAQGLKPIEGNKSCRIGFKIDPFQVFSSQLYIRQAMRQSYSVLHWFCVNWLGVAGAGLTNSNWQEPHPCGWGFCAFIFNLWFQCSLLHACRKKRRERAPIWWSNFYTCSQPVKTTAKTPFEPFKP